MKVGATAGRVGLIPAARFALRQSVFPIVNVLAAVVMVFSATMLVPLVLALARRDDGMPGFITSAAVCFFGGLALWFATRRYRREMRIRDGIMLVVLAWTLLPAVGALPLMLDGRGMSFTDAFFEAAPGSRPPVRRRSAASIPSRPRSTSGGTCCTGSGAWASSS